MTNRDRSTILVVEHDDATRAFLGDHLTADGFDVITADCPREGLRRLETSFPDLAIVDVALEDHSGLELLTHVRERRRRVSRRSQRAGDRHGDRRR